jgi:hypothetical protein
MSPPKPVPRQRATAVSSMMQCNRLVLSQSDSSLEGVLGEQDNAPRRHSANKSAAAAANTGGTTGTALTLGCLQPSAQSKAKNKKKAIIQSSAASRSSSTRATLHNETTLSALTGPPHPPPPRGAAAAATVALPWAIGSSSSNGIPSQWQQSIETATQLQLTGRGGFPIYHLLHISECEVLQPVGRWKFRLNDSSSSNVVVTKPPPASSRSALDPRRKSYPQQSSRRKMSSQVMDVLNPQEQQQQNEDLDDSDDENVNPMIPPTTTTTSQVIRLSPAKFIETELRIGTVVVDCFRRHDIVTLHSRYESTGSSNNKSTKQYTTNMTTTLTITIAECGRQQLAIIALLRHVPHAVCRAMGLHAIGDTATLEHVIHCLLQYGVHNREHSGSSESQSTRPPPPLPTFQFWSIGIPATLMSHCLYTNLMGLPGAMTKAATTRTTAAKPPPPLAPNHKRGGGGGGTPQQQSTTTTTATSSSQKRPVRVCHDDWEDLDEDETDMLCRMMRK